MGGIDEVMSMKKETYEVEGMTCASCVQAVEKTTQKLDGVKEVSVNLTTEKMTILYDENKVNFNQVKEAITNIGYNIHESKTEKEFLVEGMTCASCVQAVERVTKKLDGVKDVSVNLTTEKMHIVFDQKVLSTIDIKKAVEDTGYKLVDITKSDDKHQEKKQLEIKKLWVRFIQSLIFTIPLLYIAMGHMVGLYLPEIIDPHMNDLWFALTQLVLTTPVMLVGYSYFKVGFKTLIKRHPNMDSLIAIGTSAAYLYGVFAVIMIALGNHQYVYSLYFESAAVILTLITLGKYLEAVSKGKTSEAIKKLMNLSPKEALVIRNGVEKLILVDEVLVGDIVLVKPGMSLPVDGIVLDGYSSIDESMLTGESMPVEKTKGSKVVAASINKLGTFTYEATKVGKDRAIAKIIELVEDAQATKAPIQKLADIISGQFVPIVIILAVLSGLLWFFVGGSSVEFALTIFIAVLVIACPCALGLATPTAIMVGTGKGAEYGVLFKSGEALERLYKVNVVIFDKTGTITTGKPKLTDIVSIHEMHDDDILLLAASAEKTSEHPLAEAIIEAAKEKNLELYPVEAFDAIPGYGIQAKLRGENILFGNEKLMNKYQVDIDQHIPKALKLAESGKTPMYLSVNQKLEAIIAVADTLKSDSQEAVLALKKRGIQVMMITGDNKQTAHAIAKSVGIENVLSDVLPQDKSNEVLKLQEQGFKVAMVGDGINDSPALALADVGIAIGSGTDIAIESADVVLVKNSLMDVATAIKLSQHTIRNIQENLFWAFAYNILGIPLAMGILHIFGGPLLDPMFAALAMSLSSVSVLLNALRLKHIKKVK